MTELNHSVISAILNSEIVGHSKFGNGQIVTPGNVQKYMDLLHSTQSPSETFAHEEVSVELVKQAFLTVREARQDRGSPDLYVADPVRNAEFLARARELGAQVSDYSINKKLLCARKVGQLPKLKSVRTNFDYEDYAFACEFAATELMYETGAGIDDILCDPKLASRFDAIARGLAPGRSSLEYRWAILSIRKADKNTAWKATYQMPEFKGKLKLVTDPLESVPKAMGVYLISEKGKPLYVHSTVDLQHGIGLHRRPAVISAVASKFWEPNLEDFVVTYATLPSRAMLRPVEKKVVEEKKPLFNVPRRAA